MKKAMSILNAITKLSLTGLMTVSVGIIIWMNITVRNLTTTDTATVFYTSTTAYILEHDEGLSFYTIPTTEFAPHD